jgi:hypothetical protein
MVDALLEVATDLVRHSSGSPLIWSATEMGVPNPPRAFPPAGLRSPTVRNHPLSSQPAITPPRIGRARQKEIV